MLYIIVILYQPRYHQLTWNGPTDEHQKALEIKILGPAGQAYATSAPVDWMWIGRTCPSKYICQFFGGCCWEFLILGELKIMLI